MYNLKVKQGIASEEIIYYSSPIHDDTEKDRRKVVPTTGEICPSNRRVEWCPFEEDFIICSYMHDDDSAKKRSMRRTKQAVYDIAKSNDWEYFVTLTFNDKIVNGYDYDEVVDGLSQWLKNMRKKCTKLKYIVVPEKHPTSGRWHFHGLFMNCDELGLVESGLKTEKGQCIYNLGKYKKGWSTAIRVDGRPNISTYLTKYYTKEMFEISRGKKRYWASRNCNRPMEYKYLVEFGENEIEEMFESEFYKKEVSSAHQKVSYYSASIYTTNTMRFNTNEDEEMFPPHICICESSEDNKRRPV